MANIVWAVENTNSYRKATSNDDKLKQLMVWNYEGFLDYFNEPFDWGERPYLNWNKVAVYVQRNANDAMRLYQQWQWLANKNGSQLYGDTFSFSLDTVDYQVIAKIRLTEYDFGLDQYLARIAPAFEQITQEVNRLMSSDDDYDLENGSAMLYHQAAVLFQPLMLEPQNYAKSARTAELPVLVTASGVFVSEESASLLRQQAPPSQTPAVAIRPGGGTAAGTYKRRRME